MRQLTPEGQQIIDDLAQRYGFSRAAVMSMLYSLTEGNGAMAQFNHPEFGGSGQWMQGGMITISDMFNNALKTKIGGLCYELSTLLARQPFMRQPASSQFQSQGSQQHSRYGASQQQHQNSSGPSGAVSLFVPAGSSGNWWPEDLGMPSATGAQNNIRYAYFPGTQRLAVEINGHVTVYDTLDHQISGVSQQQSIGGSLTLTSQFGLVNVADLPVISISGVMQQQKKPPAARAGVDRVTTEPTQKGTEPRSSAPEGDIFTAIERLAELKEKGILTEEEFATKKSELLSRL